MRPGSISSTRDFRRAVGEGRRGRGGGITVHVVERPDPASRSRLGMAVDGSARGAVARNRIKRRVRAAFRACEVGPGRDVVVRVGGQVGTIQFQELVGNVRDALTRSGAV